MSSLTIQTTDSRLNFRPREEITGTITWSLDAPAQAIDLELFWTTRGKGNIDTLVADSLHFENPPLQDQRPFRLRLPDLPYTLSGRLVSVLWGIRLMIRPSREQNQLTIVVSPTGQEINLLARTS